MQLHNTLNNSFRTFGSGSVLFEVVVVLGVLLALFSVSFSLLGNSYRQSFHSLRDDLIVILQKARNQSINNVCFGGLSACGDGKSHGVHFNSSNYVLFQGDSWLDRDENFDEVINPDYGELSILGSDVIFQNLSGDNIFNDTQILISGKNQSSEIFVSIEGQISWNN